MKNPGRYEQSRFKVGDSVAVHGVASSHIEKEVRILSGKTGRVIDITKNGWVVVEIDGSRHTLQPSILALI